MQGKIEAIRRTKLERTASIAAGLALAGFILLSGCDSSTPAPATSPSGGNAAHGGPPDAASHSATGGPGGGGMAAGDIADDTSEFAAGRKVFRGQCARCHSIGNAMAGGPGSGGPGGPPAGPGGSGPGGPGGSPPGRGGPGGRGPNLANVGADPAHTVEWLVGYIREPKSVKENARMPPMQGKISDADIEAVAEYLASLK